MVDTILGFLTSVSMILSGVWAYLLLSARGEKTMVDTILSVLIAVSIILSGVLAYLLLSAHGETRHNRPIH
jgi:hypothetical protein